MKYTLICLLALLAGCGTQIREVVVKEQVIVFVDMPKQLSLDCDITTPPEKTKYLTLPPNDKEEVLATYSRHLLDDLGTCNAHMGAIRTWQDEQNNLHKKK